MGLCRNVALGLLAATLAAGPAASARAGEAKRLKNRFGMDFVRIPAGTFVMGDDAGAYDEKPAHKVAITKPFYLGTTEVTQSQYERVMGKNPARFKDPKRPVEGVCWNDAQQFCRRLSKIDPTAAYRLPTEAEWEYACRAGTTTAFYWGDKFDKRYAWAARPPDTPTIAVATLLPNAWGLYDMSGNVWELCQDFYAEAYPGEAQTDPTGPPKGEKHAVRGGSRFAPDSSARSANRRALLPDRVHDDLGFRVVCTPNP